MSLKIMSIHILLMCLSLVVWDYLWKCSVSFMVLSRGLCLLGLPGKTVASLPIEFLHGLSLASGRLWIRYMIVCVC